MQLPLRFFSLSVRRPVSNHRPRLRDLHHFGIVSIYRRSSIFRLWEPLRGDPASNHEFQG